MNTTKLITIAFLLSIFLFSCKRDEAPRRPISQSSGTFIKKSIELNKKIVSIEELELKAVIKRNPKIKFIVSNKGYWYGYLYKNETDTLCPQKGDIAFFDYDVKDLKGNVIYTKEELKPQIYRVDKQEIMIGLRDGIKLMHKKDKVAFLFPSHIAYGFHGDNNKIGTNKPLLCIVTLKDFKSEIAYLKEEKDILNKKLKSIDNKKLDSIN